MVTVLVALVVLALSVALLWFAVGRTEAASTTLGALDPDEWREGAGGLREAAERLSDAVAARERR